VVSPSGGTQRHPALGLFLMLRQMLLFLWLEFNALVKHLTTPRLCSAFMDCVNKKWGSGAAIWGPLRPFAQFFGIFEPFLIIKLYL
jgi:hypothetical protein